MEKPKKLAAMDLLVKSAALKPALSQDSVLSRSPISNLRNGIPVEISPETCRAWKFADRPPSETQHVDELIKSFQDGGIGQIQPIVVRQVKDSDVPEIEYEVICGRVRWLAAKELGVPVQATVRDLSDQEAYVLMSTENKQRRNLSHFAKAKSYQKALSMGLFDSAQQLADAEGISKSKLSLYLGFAELPDTVVEKFADITKVPYRLGYEINKTCKAIGIEETIKIIPDIESGSLSRTDVQNMQANVVTSGSNPIANGQSVSQPSVLSIPLDQKADSMLASWRQDNVLETKGLVGKQSDEQIASIFSDSATPLEQSSDEKQASNIETITVNNDAGDATSTHAIIQAPSILKNILLSSSGRKLFTYNNASRGWLIRIDPEISKKIDEDFMKQLGTLIESYCGQSK